MMQVKYFDTVRAAAGLRRAAALIALTALSGLAHAVDFKGVELGETLWLNLERDVFGALDCNPLQLGEAEYQEYILEMQAVVAGAQQVCVATTSIATVPSDVTVVLGLSRRVLRLTFQFAGTNYPLVLRAMTDKWGDGVHEVRGEKDESMWWDFSDGSSVSVHRSPTEDSRSEMSSVGLAEYMLSTNKPTQDL